MFRSALTSSLRGAARPVVQRASITPIATRGYHENVISHYEKPRNVCHKFPKNDLNLYLITLHL